MNKLMQVVKKNTKYVPAFIGTRLACIPFKYRLGSSYGDYKKKSTDNRKKTDIFSDIKRIVQFSESNIEFYKKFYKEHGFTYKELDSFDDLSKVPILTKSDLQNFSLDERVINRSSGIITNTGGTSGQPLEFLVDYEAYSREWAHMHTVWEQLGYKTSSIKITLRGTNLGSQPIKYNFIHNEFQINAYCEFSDVVKALEKLLAKYPIGYIHGYPSAIYEFVKRLSSDYPRLLKSLKFNLQGVLFGSEYPAIIYRDYIESVLSVKTLSWYGHSEKAVLASERQEPFVYYPFQSYGFAEVALINSKSHLLGTTIHNRAGPLIRYDTGDIVEPVSFKDGVLGSFKITEGRVGEFVTDSNSRRISLTALIFGRHHELFSHADFVQVKQPAVGELIIYVTSKNLDLRCENLFDSSGINMKIYFQIMLEPFKTKTGKVPLIIE